MSLQIEEQLRRTPVIRHLYRFVKKIRLPGFGGYSLYDLLETYTIGIIQGTFTSRASSIAFNFFMAVFPFLLFILNLIPYIRVENFQARFLTFINDILPPQTHEFFYPVIEDIALNPRSGLLSFTFFLTLFLTTNGVNAIFSAFEYSYHVDISRGIMKQYLVAMGVAVFFSILTIVTVGVILFGEYAVNFLKTDAMIQNDAMWISIIQFVVFSLMLYVIVATLYHFGVKRGRKTPFFSIGSLLTTFLFLVTTYLFGVYINNFSQYNELYGSIGALLIMLFYIWINSNLMLLGFELNVSIDRLKKNRRR